MSTGDDLAAPTVSDAPTVPPGRGRQAEARRNDRAILEAARDLVAIHGADVSVAAVALRAAVGMGSLYRRYGTKTELLQALCVMAMREADAAARSALAEPDPWTGVVAYVRAGVEMRSGALASLAGHVPVTAEMTAAARLGQGVVDRIVGRAHSAGVLREDVSAPDLQWLVEQLGRRPPGELPDGEHDRVRRRLTAIALDGLRAGQHDPLPGRAPSRTAYRARWRYDS